MTDNIEWKRYWLMVGLHPALIPDLKNALYQDVDTGRLRWKDYDAGKATPDGLAGWVHNNEQVLMYKRRTVNASSVVWLLHHDVLPPNGVVKYRDGNPHNLRIENLFLTPSAT